MFCIAINTYTYWCSGGSCTRSHSLNNNQYLPMLIAPSMPRVLPVRSRLLSVGMEDIASSSSVSAGPLISQYCRCRSVRLVLALMAVTAYEVIQKQDAITQQY